MSLYCEKFMSGATLGPPPRSQPCGCSPDECIREQEEAVAMRGGPSPEAIEALKQSVEALKRERAIEEHVEDGEGRISRDHMFLAMAKLAALRSTCKRGHVGALLVVDKHPVSLGYNGAPPGHAHCIDVGCEELTLYEPGDGGFDSDDWLPVELGCQRTIHAEANAIAWAARMGVPTVGSTLYCTHAPCRACARLVAASGATRVVYEKDYRADGLDILLASDIQVIQHG